VATLPGVQAPRAKPVPKAELLNAVVVEQLGVRLAVEKPTVSMALVMGV